MGEFIEMAAACAAIFPKIPERCTSPSALGVPSVTIFGATNHDYDGPTGPSPGCVREPVMQPLHAAVNVP